MISFVRIMFKIYIVSINDYNNLINIFFLHLTRPSRLRSHEHVPRKTYCTIISCKKTFCQCCEKGYRYNSIRIQMPKYCFQPLCHFSITHNSLPHKCTQYLTCPVFTVLKCKQTMDFVQCL